MFGGADGENSTSKSQAQTNQTPSEIKTALETWYEKNIYDTGYNNYIADEIFCNDRSTPEATASGLTSDTGLGYGTNTTAYGAFARLFHNNTEGFIATPQFTCPQDNDKFTAKEESGGNGKLEYPVGLITGDEIVAAGGKLNTINNSYYLYKGLWYWSFSPLNYNSINDANILAVDNNSKLSGHFTSAGNTAAPVINIKAEYLDQFIGDGTAQNPYRLQE